MISFLAKEKSASSVKEAISLASSWAKNQNIYFAGGYGIYKEALPLVDVMYITEVKITVEKGDVFFPDFNPDDFDFEVEESGGEEIKYIRTKYLLLVFSSCRTRRLFL